MTVLLRFIYGVYAKIYMGYKRQYMRLAVSGVSLAASRSRSAPTPLAKTPRRRRRRKAVGWAVCCVAKIFKVLAYYALSDFGPN